VTTEQTTGPTSPTIAALISRPRRGLRRADAANYVGVSASKFDRLVADGRMPQPIKIDGCTVWDIRQLDRAIDVLAEAAEDANPWSQVTLQ
jgi:predicted DNA-binding transcriptional regulator AlpA